MVPWEGLFGYLLVLVLAAVAGWLPFRLMEYAADPELIDQSRRLARRRHRGDSPGETADVDTDADAGSWICPVCGTSNDPDYSYCGRCGRRY